MRIPRTSSDPAMSYPQAGPTRLALLPSRGPTLHTRPYRSRTHCGARDDTAPHRTDADSGATHARQEVPRGPSQAPLPRLPTTSPRRHRPMPRARTRPRRQARHPATTRIRTRPRPTTPRPRTPRGYRARHLLAVRPTHHPRRPVGPRPRRPRPVHHARSRACIHVQQERCRSSSARTRAALTSNDARRRGAKRGRCMSMQRPDLQLFTAGARSSRTARHNLYQGATL